MDRPTFVLICAITITIVLLLIRIYLLIELGTLSYEHDTYQRQLRETRRENSLLREQILHKSSLDTLQKKATEQGFYPAESSDYIFL